ncbi:MAG TPA: alpha/beta hydrolase-fold protein [Thermoanaerobaculia bacterium]|jgi:predicted esterase
MTTRHLLFALAATLTLTSCATAPQPQTGGFQLGELGRIYARPKPVASPSSATGLQKLNLASGDLRDGWYYVPAKHATPAPLILMLHGSLDDGETILRKVQSFADDIGAIVVVPDSRSYTWEIAKRDVAADPLDRLGKDVIFLDRALAYVFERHSVDPKRVAIGGFSDGGTTALSLGLMNGDLFTHVMAFSPGFVRLRSTSGQPHVFLAHGTGDDVLPIDTSRAIARAIDAAGYEVEFIEFEGKHVVSEDVAKEALTEWFVGETNLGASN